MSKRTGHRPCMLGLAMLILFMICFSPALSEDVGKAPTRTVRVSCGMNQALYLDGSGKPAGYLSFYLQQLAYLNNWSLEYVVGSWNDSVQSLYDGKLDLLLPTQKTDDRLTRMAFSDCIGGYQPIALYARADADIFYDDYAAYDGTRIGVSVGSSNAELLEEYAAEHHFTYTAVPLNTAEEKLAALQNGDIDMIVFSASNDVPDGKIVSILDYLPFYYCTRIDDTGLMAEVNSGMRLMLSQNSNVAATAFGSMLKGSAPLSFTKTENALLQTGKTLRIGMYNDSLPLAGQSPTGEPIGIYVDLIKAIEAKTGISIQPVLIPRDKLLYSCLNDGTVDFVIGSKSLAYNEDDTSQYMCSESIMDYITVAITRSDYKFDDAGAPVFVLTNTRTYWADIIHETFPHAAIRYCSDVKDCLSLIQDGQADVTLLNTWEYNYQSKNARFSGMLEWESLRKQTDLVLGVSKSADPTLLSIMEKAVDQVAGQEKDSIVAANLNMPYSSFDLADTWHSIRSVVLVAALILLLLTIGLFSYLHIRKKHTRELEQKNQQLEKTSKAKDLFLSRMSHELRTPLNAINGYATVLRQSVTERQDTDEKTTLSYIDAILLAGQYQLAIISDLLDIQKIEAGKLVLVPTEVDSAEYMKNIAAMIAPEAKEKGIDFTFERLNTTHQVYLLDGVRFEQVLLNLLHNAVKFTPAGGKVRMTAEVIDHTETANVLKIVISDTGIGMSEDFRRHALFHRFAQEYKGNTSPYEGCGTGLAISRDIIRLMGGDITCESTQGVGSAFTVVLTAKRADGQKKPRRSPYVLKDLSGIHVLLCEDNLMNQNMERRLLEKMYCTVDVAGDGRIGVEQFCQSPEGTYNAILMDIRMPNMDGLEATRTIRALDRRDAKTVPILAVSANSFEEDVRNSLSAGMNEHLSKPVDARMLCEKLDAYCKRHGPLDTADDTSS